MVDVETRRLPYVDDALQERLRCDSLGHAWDLISDDWTPSVGVAETCRCVSCFKERRGAVDPFTGVRLTKPRYKNPPGYRKYDKTQMPSRSEFRLMLLNLKNKTGK